MERGNRISYPQVLKRSRDVPQQESLNELQSGVAPAKGKEEAAQEQEGPHCGDQHRCRARSTKSVKMEAVGAVEEFGIVVVEHGL